MSTYHSGTPALALKNRSAAAWAALASAVALTEEVARAQTTAYVPATPLFDQDQFPSLAWDPISTAAPSGAQEISVLGCHGFFRFDSFTDGSQFDDAQVLMNNVTDVATPVSSGMTISDASASGSDVWGSFADFTTLDTPFFFAYRLHETASGPSIYDYGYAEAMLTFTGDVPGGSTITVYQWGLSAPGTDALVADTAAIPEPAVGSWLMGAVTLGLVGWRRLAARRRAA